MRKLLILLFLGLVLITKAMAQPDFSSVDTYMSIYKLALNPCTSIATYTELSEKVKITYCIIHDNEITEGRLGLAYSPAPFITLGLSAGLESAPVPYRVASQLILNNKKNYLSILLEKGSGLNNYHYKTVLSFNFGEKFDAGAVAWRFHGIGPIFRYRPEELNGTVWLAPTYDLEDKSFKVCIGLSADFSPEAIRKPL